MPKSPAPYMKRKLDRLVARYIYSSYTPFLAVENRKFQMVSGLHPGFSLPTREEVQGHLNSVYNELEQGPASQLKDEAVTVDCWR